MGIGGDGAASYGASLGYLAVTIDIIIWIGVGAWTGGCLGLGIDYLWRWWHQAPEGHIWAKIAMPRDLASVLAVYASSVGATPSKVVSVALAEHMGLTASSRACAPPSSRQGHPPIRPLTEPNKSRPTEFASEPTMIHWG